MIKKLIGAAIATGIAAIGAKVVSDILKADEEELISIENEVAEQPAEEENQVEE